MTPTQAQHTIANLRKMTTQEADTELCRMHSSQWFAIAQELGIRLPTIGGDKPAIIIGALGLKRI